MNKPTLFLSTALTLAACASAGPGEGQIRDTLKPITERKGCASSVLFRQFPIEAQQARPNQHIIAPFEGLGFIAAEGERYVLTEAGQRAYDSTASGFCYTDGYEIRDIRVVRAEPDAELPPALSGAWQVSFTIAPLQVSDWVHDPALQEAAGRHHQAMLEPRSMNVRLGRKVEDGQLVIADPTFSFTPGLSFSMGF